MWKKYLFIISFFILPTADMKKKSFPTRKNKSPDSSFHSVSHKNIFFHKNVFSILLFIYFTFLFLQFCAWNEEENHIVSEMNTKKCLSKRKTFCFTQNFETKEKFKKKKKGKNLSTKMFFEILFKINNKTSCSRMILTQCTFISVINTAAYWCLTKKTQQISITL